MMERKRRLFLRSITWRIAALVLSTVIAWAFTGNPLLGAKIGIAYNIVAFWTHLVHDIIWSRTRWGVTVGVQPQETA